MKAINLGEKLVSGSLLLALLFSSLPVVANAATYKRSNQDCTAYNTTGSPTASGEWPEIGMVAVHPTAKNGNTPVIPFGTFLYVDTYVSKTTGTWDGVVPTPEDEASILKVADIGDKKFNRGLSTYFLDVFFGDYVSEAVKFGKGTITYHYDL